MGISNIDIMLMQAAIAMDMLAKSKIGANSPTINIMKDGWFRKEYQVTVNSKIINLYVEVHAVAEAMVAQFGVSSDCKEIVEEFNLDGQSNLKVQKGFVNLVDYGYKARNDNSDASIPMVVLNGKHIEIISDFFDDIKDIFKIKYVEMKKWSVIETVIQNNGLQQVFVKLEAPTKEEAIELSKKALEKQGLIVLDVDNPLCAVEIQETDVIKYDQIIQFLNQK